MRRIDPRVGRGPMEIDVGHVPPKMQDDATLNQAAPTSGLPYIFLHERANARLIGASVEVTWTVQPTPLEIHVEIDGITYTFKKSNPVTATRYSLTKMDFEFDETAQSLYATNTGVQAFVLEGRSIIVSAETTGGTVSNMSALARYALY